MYLLDLAVLLRCSALHISTPMVVLVRATILLESYWRVSSRWGSIFLVCISHCTSVILFSAIFLLRHQAFQHNAKKAGVSWGRPFVLSGGLSKAQGHARSVALRVSVWFSGGF